MITLAPLTRGTDTFHQWTFDFAVSGHGFMAGYADLPADYDPERFNLESGHRALPGELGGEPALFINGRNLSDDLWMYWKKQITGLKPSAEYLVTLEIQFASNEETGSIGIGGSPGDSVFLKGGLTPMEPDTVPDSNEILRMNIDKGNQAQGGEDVPLLGTIAKPEDGNDDFVILTRANHGNPQTVTTAEDGSLWLIFGTDSGFEGETSLYYTRVRLWANRIDAPKLWLDRQPSEDGLRLIWNTGFLETSTQLRAWEGTVEPDRPLLYNPTTDSSQFWRLVTE